MTLAMAALVAMASIETSVPLRPSFAARRSTSTGIAVVSLLLSLTASWPGTRREVVAKAETKCSGARPALRSWLRREVLPSMATKSGWSGVSRTHGGEAGREQAGIDAVHQHGQPASARHAVMIGQTAAQEVEMRPPVGDQIIVVAIADRTADNQKQHFRQRMCHPPWLTRIFNTKNAPAAPSGAASQILRGRQGSWQGSESWNLMESDQPQS